MAQPQPEPESGSDSEPSTLHLGVHPVNAVKETSQQTSSASSIDIEVEKDIEGDAFEPTNQPTPHATAEKAEGGGGGGGGSAAAVGAPSPVHPMMDPSSFPDGGLRAWLVVLGAACSLFASFGWINAIGVFQEYYETHQLKEYTSQEIAWIPSLEGFMMFIGGLWVGRAYDNYGPRWILLIGSFLHVFGLMMASLSKKYYQFVLSQGVCSPLGASMIFYPSMTAVVTWFYQKRALALGITASGSSLGGVIFPIMVQRLIPEVGFGWSMRICAFLILGLMVVANLTIVSRIPPHPRPVRFMDFISPFKELPFVLLTFGSFLTFLGLFLPFTFIILAGAARGVPEHIAQYLVSILNAASIFGRTLPGHAADKLGRFTVFLSMSVLSAVITLALWLPASGTGAVVTFALIFGFSSGSIVSLAPTLIAQISDVRQIGVRTGTMFSLVALAVLVGSPIGGQLVISDNGGYRKMQAFSGALMAGGALMYAALRVRVGGWSLTKKV